MVATTCARSARHHRLALVRVVRYDVLDFAHALAVTAHLLLRVRIVRVSAAVAAAAAGEHN